MLYVFLLGHLRYGKYGDATSVVRGNVPTSNATVYIIGSVLMPSSS
jgi:hypothetical protein